MNYANLFRDGFMADKKHVPKVVFKRVDRVELHLSRSIEPFAVHVKDVNHVKAYVKYNFILISNERLFTKSNSQKFFSS